MEPAVALDSKGGMLAIARRGDVILYDVSSDEIVHSFEIGAANLLALGWLNNDIEGYEDVLAVLHDTSLRDLEGELNHTTEGRNKLTFINTDGGKILSLHYHGFSYIDHAAQDRVQAGMVKVSGLMPEAADTGKRSFNWKHELGECGGKAQRGVSPYGLFPSDVAGYKARIRNAEAFEFSCFGNVLLEGRYTELGKVASQIGKTNKSGSDELSARAFQDGAVRLYRAGVEYKTINRLCR
ncbi:hypothetical protein HN695_03195 [Candidatus Woesearchaeota archaeon]|jgi:hypothetical protein|nr:hypothetical protein [Candidatus Woesearchaeota archaeon]MBT5271782.1 hypothetical protein [Candidatus Woesearchaeota archaeon]MBT6041177.1 hypothetical protein [Candidatus Woesearchaeota archaeon]MBT6336298.1 hypothetical protein [Candidatus Woesearchaeota archaeon]MBT7927316.1 hypothetical protein [Candidatus Woesearchaeota archaeon]